MMQEVTKAIIWPREGEHEGKKVYRYVIVGMVVTDQPIEALEGVNEGMLEGFTGIAACLEGQTYREPNMASGDANNVLLSLQYL